MEEIFYSMKFCETEGNLGNVFNIAGDKSTECFLLISSFADAAGVFFGIR